MLPASALLRCPQACQRTIAPPLGQIVPPLRRHLFAHLSASRCVATGWMMFSDEGPGRYGTGLIRTAKTDTHTAASERKRRDDSTSRTQRHAAQEDPARGRFRDHPHVDPDDPEQERVR